MNLQKLRGVVVVSTICLCLGLLTPQASAQSDFSRASTQQFKLNAAGMGVSRETLRANLNAAARSAAGTSQGNSNMANVIQNTENYEIVLNGNGNTVDTASGGIKGTQDGAGLGQTANNQIYTNSQTATAPSGTAQAGVTVLNR